MPRSLGGKGDGQNPEQLFAMGYSGAYGSSFFFYPYASETHS
jgi:organic hydroperoxide reductase OsmC/OhrA